MFCFRNVIKSVTEFTIQFIQSSTRFLVPTVYKKAFGFSFYISSDFPPSPFNCKG